MSSAIMSLLISHLLTFVESELIKATPEIVQALIQDIESLISKLESIISSKSPQVAAITNPILNKISDASIAAVSSAGQSITESQQA